MVFINTPGLPHLQEQCLPQSKDLESQVSPWCFYYSEQVSALLKGCILGTGILFREMWAAGVRPREAGVRSLLADTRPTYDKE